MKSLELKIPPLLLILLSAILMFIISKLSTPVPIPFMLRTIGFILLMLIGLLIILAGLMIFRKAKTSFNPIDPQKASKLVTTGIYRYTRNPMYLGFVICLLAWNVYLANVLALCILVGTIVYITQFQIRPEERALEDIFGDAFLTYKKNVRRWI